MTSFDDTFDQLHIETVRELELYASNWLFNCRNKNTITNNNDCDRLQVNRYCDYELKRMCDENGEVTTNVHDEFDAFGKCGMQVQSMIERMSEFQLALQQLRTLYAEVSEKTSSLHDACDQLMADQTHLASATEEIHSKLHYFDHVQSLMQKLSSPNMSVSGQSFTLVLATIDECIAFMVAHPDYKESSHYLGKYNQCLSKALTAIKSYLQQTLNVALDNISKKSEQHEDTFAMLYGVFASQAQSVRAVMETIECKFDRSADYQSIIAECYQIYFNLRKTLLRPTVVATIQDLSKRHSHSSCAFARSGCSFLLRLCEDECRVFFQFFTRPTPLLLEFNEHMCRIFYDMFRPIVIHCPHLETLTEICAIMKVEMLEERCVAIDTDVYDGFVRVIGELVGDVGERLVYRTHMYADADIRKYSPAQGDLAYPDKLIMMRNISNASSTDASSAITSQQQLSAVDMHGLWYPTVKRAVLCLSKLFRCLETTVFQGVSQEVLSMCVESLQTAAEMIAQKKKPLDAQLFLVKHLLILREQTSPYRPTTTAPASTIKDYSVDFFKFKDSAAHFFTQKDRWFLLGSNNAFLEFLFQVPLHVSESIIDGRRVLDVQLRNSCQRLISIAADSIVADVIEYTRNAEIVINTNGKQNIKSYTFMQCENVQSMLAQSYRKLKLHWPDVRESFSLYLANVDTESILLAPIRKRIGDAFASTAHFISTNYDNEDVQIIACPGVEQISLLLLNN